MRIFRGYFTDQLSILLLIVIFVNETVAMRTSTRRSTMTMTKVDTAQKVVILGAGIHGASVAHYLSSRFGIFPTVVERVSVAAAASGKAGGFLARELGSAATQQLHQVSFDLHEKLGRSEYRHMDLQCSQLTDVVFRCLLENFPRCTCTLILNSRGAESRILSSCEDTVSRRQLQRESRCYMA